MPVTSIPSAYPCHYTSQGASQHSSDMDNSYAAGVPTQGDTLVSTFSGFNNVGIHHFVRALCSSTTRTKMRERRGDSSSTREACSCSAASGLYSTPHCYSSQSGRSRCRSEQAEARTQVVSGPSTARATCYWQWQRRPTSSTSQHRFSPRIYWSRGGTSSTSSLAAVAFT